MDDMLCEFNDKSLGRCKMEKASERERTKLLVTKVISTNVRIFIIILISTGNYQFLPPKCTNYNTRSNLLQETSIFKSVIRALFLTQK